MKSRVFFPNRWMVLAVGLCFAGAFALGEDARKTTAKAATPPPKKKAEHEAEEPEAPEPDGPTPTEESFYVIEMLLGVWRTRAEDGPRQLGIQPRGKYVLAGRQTETGFMKAQLGRYFQRPDKTKQWVVGTYKFRSIDVLETDGPLGKLVWERAK